jgi:hypothetical protein
MTKFKVLGFSNLPNGAHSHFINRVSLELAVAGTPVIGALGTLPAQFETWHVKENALMDWARKDALTEQIAEADTRMDRAYVGMSTQVRALCYSPQADIAAAAGRVVIIIDERGPVYSKPYEEQVGDMDSILRQLNGPYANDAKLLALDSWITELQAAYTQFQQLLAQRDTHSLQKPDETFKEVRHGIEGVYHQIVTIIDAGAVLNIQPDFALFIDKLNPEIDRLNAEFHRVRHDIAHAQPAPIPQQAYTGQPVTPTTDVYYVTPHDGTLKLELGKDYNLSYRDNLEVGNARCIIHGKGAYRGSKTVTFIIAR